MVKVLAIVGAVCVVMLVAIAMFGAFVVGLAPSGGATTASVGAGASAADLLESFNRRLADGNKGGAREAGAALRKRYPDSPQAQAVAARLHDLDADVLAEQEKHAAKLLDTFNEHLRRGDRTAAKVVGTTLVKQFPESPAALSIADRMKQLDGEIADEAARSKAQADARTREDLAKVEKDLAAFHKERDEVNGITYYHDAKVTMQRVDDYFGLYLGVPDKGRPFLRWKFMYAADDWLFIDKLTLNVDGERLPSITFPFGSIERDNSGGRIWEWHDEPLRSDADMVPFMKLAVAKKVILRYEGRQYYNDRILSDREKQAMLKLMNAYVALRSR